LVIHHDVRRIRLGDHIETATVPDLVEEPMHGPSVPLFNLNRCRHEVNLTATTEGHHEPARSRCS
jgi:hypothetical protein